MRTKLIWSVKEEIEKLEDNNKKRRLRSSKLRRLPDRLKEKRRFNNSKKLMLVKVMMNLRMYLLTPNQSQGLQDKKILKTLNKREMKIVKER